MIGPILTGAFALGGSLGGVLVAAHLGRRAERERTEVEDRRRWVGEWRHTYAAYLGIARSMYGELESAGNCLLPEFKEKATGELDKRADALVAKWHTELQPALGEVLLIATPEVAELAARLADGLLNLTAVLIAQERYSIFESWTDKCGELFGSLINRMRSELGLPGELDSRLVANSAFEREDWPWLPSAPGSGERSK